jgi:hypothetical protein
VHIADLAILYRHTGRVAFRDMARKWLAYMRDWDAMPELADPTISKLARHYGADFEEMIERKYLAPPL